MKDHIRLLIRNMRKMERLQILVDAARGTTRSPLVRDMLTEASTLTRELRNQDAARDADRGE